MFFLFLFFALPYKNERHFASHFISVYHWEAACQSLGWKFKSQVWQTLHPWQRLQTQLWIYLKKQNKKHLITLHKYFQLNTNNIFYVLLDQIPSELLLCKFPEATVIWKNVKLHIEYESKCKTEMFREKKSNIVSHQKTLWKICNTINSPLKIIQSGTGLSPRGTTGSENTVWWMCQTSESVTSSGLKT